ncbi:MAG: protein kinase [Casimicrobiaceae bacterium]
MATTSGGPAKPWGNALPAGTRLGEFEVVRVLGEGGFGIVYLAFDQLLHRHVAIKEYLPGAYAVRRDEHTITALSSEHQATFDAGLRSFIQEARLLAKFEHPALVKVLRFWEGNGTAYMAMPHYQGHTLRQIFKTGNLYSTEAELRSVVTPLLDALEQLHAEHCFHRDISPENIIIQPNGAPVLLDFGAARRIISGMTQALTVVLKQHFAPIEQYSDDGGSAQGPWTDVYALAAVLYTGITRAPPPSAVARVYKDPLQPLAQNPRPGFSLQFLSGVDAGMAVRPEARPNSIAAFREALGPLVPKGVSHKVAPPLEDDQEPVINLPAPPSQRALPARTGPGDTDGPIVVTPDSRYLPPPPAPQPGRRRAVAIALGAVVVVGALVAGYIALSRHSVEAPAKETVARATPPAEVQAPVDTGAAAKTATGAANPTQAAPDVGVDRGSPVVPASGRTAASGPPPMDNPAPPVAPRSTAAVESPAKAPAVTAPSATEAAALQKAAKAKEKEKEKETSPRVASVEPAARGAAPVAPPTVAIPKAGAVPLPPPESPRVTAPPERETASDPGEGPSGLSDEGRRNFAAAERGDASAQVALGKMYAAGNGAPRSDADAARWFRKAADQGSAEAGYFLGVLYANGRGVPKDPAEAAKWYRKAADQGNALAQNNLGAMYVLGQGLPKDEAEAFAWYRKAADQGNARAQANLAAMYANGQGVARDEAEAARWYRRAGEQGSASAQYNLAVIYRSGLGVMKDEREALVWYRKAAAQGYAPAVEGLKSLESAGVK